MPPVACSVQDGGAGQRRKYAARGVGSRLWGRGYIFPAPAPLSSGDHRGVSSKSDSDSPLSSGCTRGCRNEKKTKLGVSNTPYDGGRWLTVGGWCVTDGGWWVTDGGWCVTDGGWCVTDGGWWVTDGGWWVTDGSWCVTDGGWWVTDGGWCVTDGGWCVTDGSWWVTDGGWWVATKHQREDATVKKKKGERHYGTPWAALL